MTLLLLHFSIHIRQFVSDSNWKPTSQRRTVQKPNLALSYITSSTRMYSVRKLWIYFFFMKLETCSCIGWAASVLNQIWGRDPSPEGNKIGPQLLRRLINESQVWVPDGDNLIGRRGGTVTTTHTAVCYMAPLAQTCQSRRGQVR